MTERDVELLETVEALIHDMVRAGWHVAVAIATPDARATEMWLSANPLVAYSLAELLRDKAYDELVHGVDAHDES